MNKTQIDIERNKWIRNIPDLFHGAYRRTYRKAVNHESMRAAVNAKCQDCCCWQQAEVKNRNVIVNGSEII